MYIIVGLGNPGEDYTKTRHNLGFLVLDRLAKGFSANHPLQVEMVTTDDVVYAKPTTFMNNSGHAVKKLLDSFKTDTQHLIVIHDDITLDLGQVKISKGAGAGNHNGVQSIIDNLSTKDFIRVRCGISRGDGVLHDVVLSKFKSDEEEIIQLMISKAADACNLIVKEGFEKAMNKVN